MRLGFTTERSQFELVRVTGTDDGLDNVIIEIPSQTARPDLTVINPLMYPGTWDSETLEDGSVQETFVIYVSTTYGVNVRVFNLLLSALSVNELKAPHHTFHLIYRESLDYPEVIYGQVMARLISGSIKPVDDSALLNRHGVNSVNAQMFAVQMIHTGWEYMIPAYNSQAAFVGTDVSLSGGVFRPQHLGRYGSSQRGRIRAIAVQPSPGAKIKKMWIGIKDGVGEISGEAVNDYFVPSITVSDTATKFYDTQQFSAPTSRVSSGVGLQVNWYNTKAQNVRDVAGKPQVIIDSFYDAWLPRFRIPMSQWNTHLSSGTAIEKRRALVSLLGRFKLIAKMYTDIGVPEGIIFGIRARLVYTNNGKEYNELANLGEFYYRGTGGKWRREELGEFTLGNYGALVNRRTDLEEVSLSIDATVLNLNEALYPDATIRKAVMDQCALLFDDFGLCPAEHSVVVELPNGTHTSGSIEILTDELGDVTAWSLRGQNENITEDYKESADKPTIVFSVPDIYPSDAWYWPGSIGTTGQPTIVIFGDTDEVSELTTSSTARKFSINVVPRAYGHAGAGLH